MPESGGKFSVEKWKVKASSTCAHRALATKAVRSRKISSAACTVSVGNSSIKEARFVADFLAAQARPFPRGRQLYSHVVSDKKAETRMKYMETAICDVRRLLERLTQPPREG